MRIPVYFVILFLLGMTGFLACPQQKEPGTQEAPTVESPAASSPIQPSTAILPGGWVADVRENLNHLISTYGRGTPNFDEAKPPAVVLDFDNTCIRGDLGRAFYDWMVRERKIRFDEKVWEAFPADQRTQIRKAWNELAKLPAEQQPGSEILQKFRKLMHKAYWSLCTRSPAEKCFPWQVRFYASYTPDELTSMAKEVLRLELQRPLGSEQLKEGKEDLSPAITSTGIRIYEEVKNLIAVLQEKGFQVWIVSAGPEWVVKGAADFIGVPANRIIGMRTKLSSGKLTTEIEPPATSHEGKVEAIKKFIGVQPVLVLGDSWTDAEMLQYGQQALLIDRGYADLNKKAVESKWWIQPAFTVK